LLRLISGTSQVYHPGRRFLQLDSIAAKGRQLFEFSGSDHILQLHICGLYLDLAELTRIVCEDAPICSLAATSRTELKSSMIPVETNF